MSLDGKTKLPLMEERCYMCGIKKITRPVKEKTICVCGGENENADGEIHNVRLLTEN